MADVTGILLNGWFLKSTELQEDIPKDALDSMHEIDIYEPELEWLYPKDLPPNLRNVYQTLTENQVVQDWCRQSFVWRSLHSENYLLQPLVVFPFGSIASRLAALMLVEMLRDEGKASLFISPPIVRDEDQESPDSLIQACAKRTWEWLGRKKTVIQSDTVHLNLTACNTRLKCAYQWIAAYARLSINEFDGPITHLASLAILDWLDDTQDLTTLPVPDEDSLLFREFIRDFPDRNETINSHGSREHKSYPTVLGAVLDNSYLPVSKAYREWYLEQKEEEEARRDSLDLQPDDTLIEYATRPEA